jgi:hypothetical protein
MLTTSALRMSVRCWKGRCWKGGAGKGGAGRVVVLERERRGPGYRKALYLLA